MVPWYPGTLQAGDGQGATPSTIGIPRISIDTIDISISRLSIIIIMALFIHPLSIITCSHPLLLALLSESPNVSIIGVGDIITSIEFYYHW